MDDFGNTLAPRDSLIGYVWWMYGFESYRVFYVGFDEAIQYENDNP